MRASPDMPPLHALRAFEAAGRLLSFRRAAEELAISQSAVSHHVAQIERFLGARLFVRKARGVDLTPAAARFLSETQAGFARLASATARIRKASAREKLRVSLLPSFAANFLVRRLAEFSAANPSIEVVLDPTLDLADVAASAADLAIRYGNGAYADVTKRPLGAERLVAVASPAFLKSCKITRSADVCRHPLLTGLRLADWTAWAAAMKVDIRKAEFRQLTDYNIVLQAALDGQGIAIGRMLLVERLLRNGRLITLFPDTVVSPRAGYWLVSARHRRYSGAMTRFAEWLESSLKKAGVPAIPEGDMRLRQDRNRK